MPTSFLNWLLMATMSQLWRDTSNSASRIAQTSKIWIWWKLLRRWEIIMEYHQIWIRPRLPLLRPKASRTATSLPPPISPLQIGTSPSQLVQLGPRMLLLQMKTSAQKASSTSSAKNGRMKWIESFPWAWMATSAEKNRVMIAWSNRVTQKLRVTNCCSSMVMLLKCSIMPSSRRLWCKYPSSMCDLTTSSALPIFQSWRDSWIWRSCCSRTTTSIVSYKSQSLKHCKPWIRFQLRIMKCLTPFSSELSLSIDFPMLLKSMEKLFLTPTSTRLVSNSSTLTKSFRLQPYSRLRSRTSHMETKARKKDKIR